MGLMTSGIKQIALVCWVLSLLVLWCALPAVSAANARLLGAEAVLEKIEGIPVISSQSQAESTDSFENIRNDLEQFKKKSGLSPVLSAKEWLSILERFWKLSQKEKAEIYKYQNREGNSTSLNPFIQSIPGPETWAILLQEIEKHVDSTGGNLDALAVKIVLLFLEENFEAISLEIDRLDEIVSQQDHFSSFQLDEFFKQIRSYLYRSTIKNTPEEILSLYKEVIKARKEQTGETGSLTIPDLVTVAGRGEAEKLIHETMQIENIVVEVPSGGETLSLVKEVIVTNIDAVGQPQWQLIDSPDDIELFEIMDNKFGREGKGMAQAEISNVFSTSQYPDYNNYDDGKKAEASLYYIIGLVKSGRIDDAVAFTGNHNLSGVSDYDVGKVWRRIDQSRIAPSMLEFCSKVLRTSPDLPFWELYTGLSIALDELEEYLAFLDELSQDKSLSFKMTREVELNKIKAYMAQGDIDRAQLVTHEFEKLGYNSLSLSAQLSFLHEKETLGRKIAEVGQLLQRQDLVDDGLRIIKTVLNESKDLSNSPESSFAGSTSNWFIKNDYLELAETIIISSLQNKAEQFKGKDFELSFSGSSPYLPDLMKLAQVYSKAERHDDVLTLLEKAPWWGKKEFYELDDEKLSLAVAKALTFKGQHEDAVTILKNRLYENPDNDAFYEALLQAGSTDINSWLDALYKRDRFEERPLIWKAVLLLKQGRLDDAELTIREALKVDPTDGEQKAGDRVRAYAVLRDILKEKGKARDAEFFSNVVKSVRIAEKGDRFKKAGLIQMSLEYYSRAEILFGDAYCVQWRKAERLYEMGKYEEAKKHYEIAFERMPEQFGQVASFCFGCEGVFDKKHSRSIAETVLLRLERNNPERPQVFFLLGQLREAQEKYSDAYRYFKKAVELDGDYLDAWKRILRLRERIFITQEEFNAITLKMLKLDPLKKHFSSDLQKVSNFKALWPVLIQSANLSNQTVKERIELSLTRSKKSIEKHEKKFRELMPERWDEYVAYLAKKKNPSIVSPGDVLAGHFLVTTLGQLVQYSQMSY